MSSTQAPQITVLVPVYNVERYLRECLDSIRAQTFVDFEAICINDGSTDTSRDIIQEYLDTDARFRVIDKPNSGYGASMNMGLAAARGSYIAILESDDLYMPTALEVLHDAAVEHDAQVVKGEFNLYWSNPAKRVLSGELANTSGGFSSTTQSVSSRHPVRPTRTPPSTSRSGSMPSARCSSRT